ncbi:TraB/GumN family protein [Duganella sp. CY15W]|uniref:TraB/GumN family protein n=1 Tax=Duganella sp. CY15W TaxID=2692172 RepID=UPI001E4F072C|nr:TraB/GumN family protein [Duganella sp. CY15W]
MPNRGALFKVQQGGHTLYLFGTIHVGARNFYPLEPRLSGLLKKAPVLALEIDPLGDPQKLARAVQQHGLNPKGITLTPDWRQRLDRLLQQYRIEPETVATMKPWLLASLLTVSEFAAQGYEASLAVDAHLSKQAHASGKKIVELESAESQMALFDTMTAAEQLLFLQEAIAGIEDKEQANQAREIADAWRHADSKALEALALKAEMDDTYSGRFVQNVLLEGRNPALADGMVKLMARENNSVAAIGILHLFGKTSVPELLRKRGLTVERIY